MKIGIPSKGRLQADTIGWFEAAGIGMRLTGSEREYAGEVDGIDATLVLLSAGEIPREMAAGRIHLGVTGLDMVEERLPDPSLVRALKPLGFGFADLIIAVPDFWEDVETLDDLDAVAARFRAANGFRLRIATKYHRLVRDYLRKHGVADYQLVDSQGATEGTVKNLTAEAIADITTTGSTLRANHLRPLADGPILASQATLFASRAADWNGAANAYASLAERAGLPPLNFA